MKMRFGRFALVGLLGAALQLSLLRVLTKLRLSPIAATPIAVEITILHNFLWHEHFTWRHRKGKRAIRLCRFHLANGLVSLLGNTTITYCFVTRLHVQILPSALASIAICSLANFTLADHWVYSSRKQPP
jgi:putative flippase GtrA